MPLVRGVHEAACHPSAAQQSLEHSAQENKVRQQFADLRRPPLPKSRHTLALFALQPLLTFLQGQASLFFLQGNLQPPPPQPAVQTPRERTPKHVAPSNQTPQAAQRSWKLSLTPIEHRLQHINGAGAACSTLGPQIFSSISGMSLFGQTTPKRFIM